MLEKWMLLVEVYYKAVKDMNGVKRNDYLTKGATPSMRDLASQPTPVSKTP
jgi:hypothetical protein